MSRNQALHRAALVARQVAQQTHRALHSAPQRLKDACWRGGYGNATFVQSPIGQGKQELREAYLQGSQHQLGAEELRLLADYEIDQLDGQKYQI